MKLIKTKNITSGSDRLLHWNTPVNNFHFWAYELLIRLKTFANGGSVPGKCPGQAIFES